MEPEKPKSKSFKEAMAEAKREYEQKRRQDQAAQFKQTISKGLLKAVCAFGVLCLITALTILDDDVTVNNNVPTAPLEEVAPPIGLLAKNGKDIVVGQWRLVITNPTYKNSLAKDYMRHTFFNDGTLKIQEKQGKPAQGSWKVDGDKLIVQTNYKNTVFENVYELQDTNTLLKVNFRRIVSGKLELETNSSGTLIRQGSDKEQGMSIVSIFDEANDALNFIDPNLLEINKSYKLSERTPIAPTYDPMFPLYAIEHIYYVDAGTKFKVIRKVSTDTVPWYEVAVNNTTGWIKASALFGQKLK